MKHRERVVFHRPTKTNKEVVLFLLHDVRKYGDWDYLGLPERTGTSTSAWYLFSVSNQNSNPRNPKILRTQPKFRVTFSVCTSWNNF
jgi:hypothetical protein